MIKSALLRELRRFQCDDAQEEIHLDSVKFGFEALANEASIPLATKREQVKSGGLFNSMVEDCIVLYHPEHENDYIKFCVRVNRKGKYAFVDIDEYGISAQLSKAAQVQLGKEERRGKGLGYQLGSVIGEKIATIGISQSKLAEEERYYSCMHGIINQLFQQ